LNISVGFLALVKFMVNLLFNLEIVLNEKMRWKTVVDSNSGKRKYWWK